MLKRDRQALLDDLGEQRLEVGWDPYMGFALSACWYMLFLFLLPGPLALAYLPIDKDLKMAIWFLAPIPFTVATWFWYRLHNLQRKIVFSQDRFEFFNRNGSTFTFRWVEIQGIKKFRQTLTITKTDGTSVKVVIPQVKTSRDKSWFDALIASYLPPNNAKTRARKLATGSLIFSLTCLTLAVAMGRPRMMKPDQEIPFVMIDYINLGLWAIAVTGVIIGSIGIFGFLEAFGSSKQREVEPELKNAFEVRVEKNFGWLESIELEPGRKYRYVEPEGLKKALRSQRMGLLGIVAVLLIVIIVLSSMILSDHRSRGFGTRRLTAWFSGRNNRARVSGFRPVAVLMMSALFLWNRFRRFQTRLS